MPTCPKCNRIFRDSFNLQRHLDKQQDCAATTDQVTAQTSAEVIDHLLYTLRGPLRVDDTRLDDEPYMRQVVGGVWRAVEVVAQTDPSRNMDRLMIVLELLNGAQLHHLYGGVLVHDAPPSPTLATSLRALYRHILTLHKKGVTRLYRKNTENILSAMRQWPGLVGEVVQA